MWRQGRLLTLSGPSLLRPGGSDLSSSSRQRSGRCGCWTRFGGTALSRAPGSRLASCRPLRGAAGLGPGQWGRRESRAPGIKASCTEVAWTGLALPAAPTPSLWVDPAVPWPPLCGTGFVPSCCSSGDSETLPPCPMKGGQAFPIRLKVWRDWAPQSPWCSRTGRRELGAGEQGRACSPQTGGASRQPVHAPPRPQA